MKDLNPTEQQELERQRQGILQQTESWLEPIMVLLGFVWLFLLVIELTQGLTAQLELGITVIWIIFILDFVLRLWLAPRRVAFLKSNWLTMIALIVPALRVFRIVQVLRVLRFARATRGLRLLRLMTSVNRGMAALSASMGRRGFGYVVALTGVVTLAGAAGMYSFERDIPGGLNSYGHSLWWTAMLITTVGSDYWPQSPEGRVLCFVLSLYGFAILGYVTATLATFFIGRDAEDDKAEMAGSRSVERLRADIAQLRDAISELANRTTLK